jgi:hypothetical protein
MPRTRFARTYMVPEIPHFNWESLESASGLTFTEHQRTALMTSMHDYLCYLIEECTPIQIKDVRHQHQEILKHAKALVDLLGIRTKNTPHDNDRVPSDEDHLNFHHAVFSHYPPSFDSRSYLRVMIQLRLNTEIAIQNVSKEGKPGRQDKGGLDTLIRAWHRVYREAGGDGDGCTRSGSSRTAKGPFLDLIDEALGQLETHDTDSRVESDIPDTKYALAQRILAALKKSRRLPQARDEN